MKNFILLTILLILGLFVASCGNGAKETETKKESPVPVANSNAALAPQPNSQPMRDTSFKGDDNDADDLKTSANSAVRRDADDLKAASNANLKSKDRDDLNKKGDADNRKDINSRRDADDRGKRRDDDDNGDQ